MNLFGFGGNETTMVYTKEHRRAAGTGNKISYTNYFYEREDKLMLLIKICLARLSIAIHV